MTILFDGRRPVKSGRPFGAGILASYPTYRSDHTAADEAWLIEDNARREAMARLVDRRYTESSAVDSLSIGLIPPDVAETIARTSLVGHDD